MKFKKPRKGHILAALVAATFLVLAGLPALTKFTPSTRTVSAAQGKSLIFIPGMLRNSAFTLAPAAPMTATATATVYLTAVPSQTSIATATITVTATATRFVQPTDTPTPGGPPNNTPTATVEPTQDVSCDKTTADVAFDLHIPPSWLVQTGKYVPGDNCKWNLERGAKTVFAAKGYQFDPTYPWDSEPPAAIYGDDQFQTWLGATIRPIGPNSWFAKHPEGAWVFNGCTMLRHTQDFADQETPSYFVWDVQGLCSSWPHKVTRLAGCPTDEAGAASLLGGQPGDWKNEGFTSWRPFFQWHFKTSGGRFADLKWPGFGRWMFWDQTRYPYPWRGGIPWANDATFECQ